MDYLFRHMTGGGGDSVHEQGAVKQVWGIDNREKHGVSLFVVIRLTSKLSTLTRVTSSLSYIHSLSSDCGFI